MTVAAARGRGAALLALAGVALLAGLWGALALLGLRVPAAATTAEDHGVLMTLGFLGTMIAVERAVALARPWGWAAPVASGVGALWLLGGVVPAVGQALLALAGVALVAVYAAIQRIQPSVHTPLMAVGAAAWAVAAALWLFGWDVARLVPWLATFLVATIAAERLELSRLVGASRPARRALVAAVALLGSGAVVSAFAPAAGVRLAGVALVALAGWLVTQDAARRTVRAGGVTRFMAAGLLAGYGWLATAGVLWAVGGFQDDTRLYDAQLHALFLGFVISMVFAHAPVIAPAVLRRPMAYRPRFYVHLGLLHLSLLVRVAGGDAAGSHLAWQVGGVLNEVALLTFVGSTALAVRQGRRERRERRERPVGQRGSAEAAPRARRRRPPVVSGVLAGLLITVVAVAAANSGSADPATGGHPRAPAQGATGSQVVTVHIRDMRYAPAQVTVSAGTRLVLDVRNDDPMHHDLALSTGAHTPLLAPGQSARLDVGTVTGPITGWCTVPGHRQAGMVMHITTGPAPRSADATSPDLHAAPAAGWRAPPAALPPLPSAREHRVTWHIRDVTLHVAPGVTNGCGPSAGPCPGRCCTAGWVTRSR